MIRLLKAYLNTLPNINSKMIESIAEGAHPGEDGALCLVYVLAQKEYSFWDDQIRTRALRCKEEIIEGRYYLEYLRHLPYYLQVIYQHLLLDKPLPLFPKDILHIARRFPVVVRLLTGKGSKEELPYMVYFMRYVQERLSKQLERMIAFYASVKEGSDRTPPEIRKFLKTTLIMVDGEPLNVGRYWELWNIRGKDPQKILPLIEEIIGYLL